MCLKYSIGVLVTVDSTMMVVNERAILKRPSDSQVGIGRGSPQYEKLSGFEVQQ